MEKEMMERISKTYFALDYFIYYIPNIYLNYD